MILLYFVQRRELELEQSQQSHKNETSKKRLVQKIKESSNTSIKAHQSAKNSSKIIQQSSKNHPKKSKNMHNQQKS
jgi:hypothetical protein